MLDRSRVRGGVFGLLLGDAAGVPYEFQSPERLAPFAPRVDMVPPPDFRRTYPGLPVGTWSDDGALSLCLLESLVESGGFDPIDQARRMVAWLDEGHLAVDGRVFDVGNTTREALDRARALLDTGSSPVGRGMRDEWSQSNGSLMRILPLALLHSGDEDDLIRRAMEHSGLTHAHPVCLACCAIYCLWARGLAAGAANPFEAAVATFGRWAGSDPDLDAALNTILERSATPPTGTGYVVDSLFSARDALERGTDFRDVVRRSILLGNDTDTTAAVAGGLAGVKFGSDGLPADWMALLRGRDVVEAILGRVGVGPG